MVLVIAIQQNQSPKFKANTNIRKL